MIKKIFIVLIVIIFANCKLMAQKKPFEVLKASVIFLVQDTSTYKNLPVCNNCNNIEELSNFYQDSSLDKSAQYIVKYITETSNNAIYDDKRIPELVSKIERIVDKNNRKIKYASAWKDYQSKINKIVNENGNLLNDNKLVEGNIDSVSIAMNALKSDIFQLRKQLGYAKWIGIGALVALFYLLGWLISIQRKMKNKLNNIVKPTSQVQPQLNKEMVKEIIDAILKEKEKVKVDKEDNLNQKVSNNITTSIVEVKKQEHKIKEESKLSKVIEPKVINTLYSIKPKNGFIHVNDLYEPNKAGGNQFFIELKELDNGTAIVNIAEKEEKRNYITLTDYKSYLTNDYCELMNDYYSGMKFEKCLPGSAVFDGDKWKIVKKISITFS